MTGATLMDGPLEGGRVEADWETGLGLFDEPPQSVIRNAVSTTRPNAAPRPATCRRSFGLATTTADSNNPSQ